MSYQQTPMQPPEQKPCMEYPHTPGPYEMNHQMHHQGGGQFQTPPISNFYAQQIPIIFDPSSLNYTENMLAMSYFAHQNAFMTPTSSSQLSPPTSNDSGISTNNSPETSPNQMPTANNAGGKICKNEDMVENEKVFCTVQGRLNLVGNLRTYRVTKPEILRRVNPPECMNSSTLAAYLRKAKTKSGGIELRQQLEKEGIRLPTNRRRAAPHTVYSAMTEEEAHQAGLDLDVLLKSFFPIEELSHFLSGRAMSPQEREERKRDLLGVIRFAEELAHLFETIQVPLMGKTVQNRFYSEPLQQKMENLSSVSHGFALYGLKSMKFIDKVLASRVLQMLEQPQGIQQGQQVPVQNQVSQVPPHMAQYMNMSHNMTNMTN